MVDADMAAKIKKGLDLGKNETSKLLHILRKGKVKVEKNIMDVLEEVGSTLEDEYENIEMEFEESVKEERNNGNNKTDKERKKRVVKSNVDVTIAKMPKVLLTK